MEELKVYCHLRRIQTQLHIDYHDAVAQLTWLQDSDAMIRWLLEAGGQAGDQGGEGQVAHDGELATGAELAHGGDVASEGWAGQ